MGATTSGTARLRLTRRGRLVVLLGTLAVSAGLGLGGVGVAGAQAGQASDAVAVSEHVVTAGETLWHIARDVTEPGADVRDTVAEIQRINGLRGSTLVAGQQLLVPGA